MAHDSPVDPPSDRYGEEGIELRRHILVLAAEWRRIALGAISFAGAAGVLMWAQWTFLPKYEASADVAIIRATPKVSIDETLRTATADTRRTSHRDRIAERAAFVGLVHNGDVAGAVVGRLGGQLDEDQNEATLLEDIDAKLVTMGVQSEANTSDLIRITASAGSPGKAMDFVNTWAEEYVKVVNRIYEKAPASLLAAVNAELVKTREKYNSSQEHLETLISVSRVSELDRQISLRTNLVDNWSTAQNNALSTNYADLSRMNSQLAAAQVLRAQIENAGEANTASNELGILLLKAEVYTSGSHAVQMEVENVFEKAGAMYADPIERRRDVDALISALEDGIHKLQMKIMSQYQYGFLFARIAAGGSAVKLPASNSRYSPGSDDSFFGEGERSLYGLVAAMEDEIRSLQQEKEQADRGILEATKKRDLLRSSLDSLENEIVELTLVKASAVSTEVRLASPAVLPEYPAGPHPILVAAFGGFVGLFAMVCFVLLMRPADGRSPFPR